MLRNILRLENESNGLIHLALVFDALLPKFLVQVIVTKVSSGAVVFVS